MNIPALIQEVTTWILPILFAVTLHEAAHGYVALRCGDQTARMKGRLTLNPLRHIDPFGTVILPGMMLMAGGPLLGWAKPVPVDFRNLRHPKRDMIWVAAAGPAVNIALALVSALLLNLAEFAPVAAREWCIQNLEHSLLINVVLAVFNLIPLPPLDGGRIVTGLLPGRLSLRFAGLERYGLLILLAALFLVPFVSSRLGVPLQPLALIIGPPVDAVIGVIARVAGLDLSAG